MKSGSTNDTCNMLDIWQPRGTGKLSAETQVNQYAKLTTTKITQRNALRFQAQDAIQNVESNSS